VKRNWGGAKGTKGKNGRSNENSPSSSANEYKVQDGLQMHYTRVMQNAFRNVTALRAMEKKKVLTNALRRRSDSGH